MIYDGVGDIRRWIVVSDGRNLSDDFAAEHCEEVMMLKTPDGELCSTTLKSAFIIVKRYPRARKGSGLYDVEHS